MQYLKKRKGQRANLGYLSQSTYMYLQPVAELRRTQINIVKSTGILKVPSAAAIRQLTTGHSSGLGVE